MKNVKWKNLMLATALPLVMAAQSYGQGSLDGDVDAELDRLYQATQSKSAQSADANAAQAPVQVQQVTVQATQPEQSAQKQPTTYIEASPLKESRSEQIRRARQETELQTEQKIVEKLEQSRIDDEKKRAETLFGDRFNQLTAPPVAPVVVPEQKQNAAVDRETLRNEISAALTELKPQEEVTPENRTYFSALAGVADYPDATNIKAQYALGFSAGRKIRDQILVEGSFLYSNYLVQQREALITYNGIYPRITELNQYNGSLLAKYQLFTGAIRPVFGAAMSYTYRSYNDVQLKLNDTLTSHALDMGLVTGVDIELTEKFALGFDFRYMWNLTNRVDNGFQNYWQASNQTSKTLESLNYYVLGLVGRASF